jgi:hypothetical protein
MHPPETNAPARSPNQRQNEGKHFCIFHLEFGLGPKTCPQDRITKSICHFIAGFPLLRGNPRLALSREASSQSRGYKIRVRKFDG